MQINYFEFVNKAWHKLESETDLSPSHRALFWAIVHRWNLNFFQGFEIDRFDLMKLSGIKSDKTFYLILDELVKCNYVEFTKGLNQKSKGIIKVAYVNITDAEPAYVNSTYVEITEADPSCLRKNYLSLYNDTDISINTTVNSILESNSIITLKEKKEKISEKKSDKKSRRKLDTTFLESEVGNFEAFCDYVKQSAYPHANPKFYFESVSDWRDKATGLEPKRQNWKLVVNQFFRNDIARNGRVVTEQNNGGNSNLQNNRNRSNQTDPAELEKSVSKLLASRAAQSVGQTEFGTNRGHEDDAVPDGAVYDF